MDSGTVCASGLLPQVGCQLLGSWKISAHWPPNCQDGQSARREAAQAQQRMIIQLTIYPCSIITIKKPQDVLGCSPVVCFLDCLFCNKIMSTIDSPFQPQQKAVQEVRNSKILSRKQIEKRLQGLKSQEYEKIASNLQSQNGKLRSEVKNLNDKVNELVQSRKLNRHNNPQIQQEVAKSKRELELKYESMSHLKEQLAKARHNGMTEEMKLKVKEHHNAAMKCDKEKQGLEEEKANLKAVIEKNQADLQEFLPNNQADEKLDALKAENRELKGKINKIKEFLTTQEKNSKSAIFKIYQLKQEEKKSLVKSVMPTASLKQFKSLSPTELNELEKEIEALKQKKLEIEKEIGNDRAAREAKKTRVDKEIRDRMQAQKELDRRRVKAMNQLNLYERKEFQLKHRLEKEAIAESMIKQYTEGIVQTEKVVAQQFRKEWLGKSEGLLFNDATILEYRGMSLIKGVTAYKSNQGLVFLKFHYQSPENKQYESQPPFDRTVLKKYQSKKYESHSAANLSNLIVFVQVKSKRIMRVELVWEDSDRSVIGEMAQECTKYPFQIGANERPVCMFGSVVSLGKHSYVLESLGCEIAPLDQ